MYVSRYFQNLVSESKSTKGTYLVRVAAAGGASAATFVFGCLRLACSAAFFASRSLFPALTLLHHAAAAAILHIDLIIGSLRHDGLN